MKVVTATRTSRYAIGVLLAVIGLLANARFAMAAPQGSQISVAVTPAATGITVSQSVTLTATVTNDSTNKGVSWTVSGSSCSGSACGTLSSVSAFSATYTAPTVGGVYTVTATSVANASQSATATIGATDLAGVYTYRNDYNRSSINSKEYVLNTSNVNASSFGKLFACTVDQAIYTQPLWVANVSINGGIHNIVIVATEADSVYAFDADNGNGTACTQYWKATLTGTAYGAASGATPVPASDTGETGDILTEIGITATPVIDPAANALYVLSKTKENGSYFQRLHKLSLATGAEMSGAPVALAASVTGSGSGSSGGTLAYSALHQNPRPGLALQNGYIYISSGSHGDNEPWHGWILQYKESTLAFTGAWVSTPNTNGGGIWMSGSAPVFDTSNNLYVITSNGTYDGNTEYGDSFVKLNTASGLTLSDWFAPDDAPTLATDNGDLGAGGAETLLDSVSGPYPHLIIGGGKEGILYLINRDNMGHFNANSNSAAVQTWQVAPYLGNYGGVSSSGEFWQNTFYIAGTDTPLEAFAFDTTKGMFNTAPVSQSNVSFGFPGVTPAISANGTSNGIVWGIDTSTNGTNGTSTGPAVLYAFDASNLNNELWDSTKGTNNQAATAVKFAVPTVANGKVYVGAVNTLDVYGLLSQGPAADPPTFSPAPGTFTSAQTVRLSDTTSGATIYYTLDGTTPTTSSPVYTTPIAVSTTTTINALAAAPGLNVSTVASATYTIQLAGTQIVTFVQGTSATPQSPTTSVVVTYPIAQTAGDLNVVVVGSNDTTHTVTSVKDSANNTYTLAVGPTQNTAGNLSQSIYYAKNITAGGSNSVTVTFSGATAYPDIRILEYSNADQNSPVDVAAAATGDSGSSTVTTSSATSNANDLLFGANMVTSITSGAGAGFTTRIITPQDGDIAEDRSVSATGIYTANANISTGQWIMQVVAFKAAPSTVDTTPPTAPTNLVATAAGDNQINLTWTASTDNVGVTGYLIERCQGVNCSSFVQIGTSTTASYTDAGDLLGSTSFSYRVRATDAAGNLSTYSNVASATTQADTTPPSTPTNLVAAPVSTSQINLTWNASTDDVGVIGYIVQRCQGASCSNFAQVSEPRTNSVDDTGLTAGTAYSYRVQATDYAGNLSGWSNIATATTPSTNAPTVTSVSPNNGSTAGGTNVTITGTNFVSGASVTFGTAAATNVSVTSSSTITATTPAGAAGAVSVTVSESGQSGSLANAFTYVAPIPIGYSQVAAATPQTAIATVPVPFPSAQTAGDLNIVVIGWNDTTSTIQSVKDSAGNTYQRAVGPTVGSGLQQSIYYASNILGGTNTVTVTFNQAATYPDVRILEYKGVTTLDVTAGASGSGTTANSGAATTTVANELIFAADTIATTTTAAGSGFTSRIVTSPDSDLAEDKIVTATGSNSATATLGSGPWVMQMATFYANGGGSSPAPTVTSVSPNTGSTLGGTSVTITGTNFVAGAAVTFGTTPATNVSVTSSTTITATTPANAAGALSVTVSENGQSGSLASGFTYAVPTPTVTGVSPNTGTTVGGTSVTITGTNFVSGATVTFGTAAATNVTVASSTTITATTPANSAGSVTVTVSESGQSGSLASGFTYAVPTPTVTGVSPNAGTTAGGTSVTISGTNFLSGATVTFGGSAATAVTVVNSTTITATTPAGSAGGVTVTVTNAGGGSGSLASGFTYSSTAPTVTGVSPNNGSTAGGSNVTITGTNFVAGATVTFGSTAATNVSVTSNTTITATSPSGSAGAVTVTVTESGQSGSLANAFTYVAPTPTVTAVSPTSGSTLGGTAVTISGTNFATGATVKFGSVPATNVSVTNSTTMTATSPANSAGAVTVMVTNPSGQSGSLASAFSYVVPTPTVTGVSPNSGSAAGGTVVTISGTNFISGAAVTFGSTAATSVSVANSTTITATTPANAIGAVTVTVTNAGGSGGSLANAFTYVAGSAPTVTKVFPNNGPTSGGTGVTITGANFISGATVTFGTTSATSVTVTSSTTLLATSPAGTAGAVTVTVTNPGGLSGSLVNSFTYTTAVAISFAQVASATPQANTATVSVAYPSTQTLGDMNIVVVGWNDTTATVQSVKDSAGNAYYLAVGPTTGAALTQSIYYASNIVSGSNTVTVTFSQAAAYPDVRILEYKGVSTLDVTAVGTGSGTSASTATATTTTANELVFGADTISSTSKAAGTGFTSRIITSPDSDIAEDKIVTATGSNSASATLASGAWVMQMATFRAGGGGRFADTTPPSAPTNLIGPAAVVQNVQGYINSTSQTVHTTAAFDSTGGDAIVVFASSHAGITMTPSDSFNNTWISVAGPTSTTTGFDLRSQIWYAKNPTVGPGHTFTLTLSASQSLVISIFVMKGTNVSNPIDVLSAIGSDAGTQALNTSSPSVTTTSADDSLIGWVKSSVANTFTAGTGFNFQTVASSNYLGSESAAVVTPGNYAATFTLATAATWQSAVVAVEPSTNSVTANQINISWLPSSDNVGVSGYFVERCQGSGCTNFAQVGTTTGTATSYSDTGLTASTIYNYRVRATDAAANLSAYSNVTTASTQP
jgi:hypothetical protein